jgi:serine/threonine-protein kinase
VKTKRQYAVKLIRPEQAGHPATLGRFAREVRSTARLSHPNIVTIYDYGNAADGTFFFVMEYLAGKTLDDLVMRFGPMAPSRAIRLLIQICGALRQAHNLGFIHRDIKPANIIVLENDARNETAKLLDFGLAKDINRSHTNTSLTQEGAVAGTPAFMSPEQASGQGRLDVQSDIYSLGAVAYFLLSGRPPFADRTRVQVMAAHLYEAPTPLTELNRKLTPQLSAVVMRCLAKQPAERYESVSDFQSALAECL